MPEIIWEIFKPFDGPVVSDKLKWNLKPHDSRFYFWATSILKECWEYVGSAVFSAFANSKMNIRTSIFLLKNAYRTLFKIVILQLIETVFHGVLLITTPTPVNKMKDALLFHVVLGNSFVTQINFAFEVRMVSRQCLLMCHCRNQYLEHVYFWTVNFILLFF